MNNAIKLKAGDSIGIFSPSSPITYTCPKRFIRAKKYLQDRSKEQKTNQLPFLADFDCCHTHPMITIPIGCQVELDATNKKVSIL